MNDDDQTVLDIAFPETDANRFLETMLDALIGEDKFIHGGTFMGEPRRRDMRYDLSEEPDTEMLEEQIKGMIQLFHFEDVEFLIYEPDEGDDEDEDDGLIPGVDYEVSEPANPDWAHMTGAEIIEHEFSDRVREEDKE